MPSWSTSCRGGAPGEHDGTRVSEGRRQATASRPPLLAPHLVDDIMVAVSIKVVVQQVVAPVAVQVLVHAVKDAVPIAVLVQQVGDAVAVHVLVHNVRDAVPVKVLVQRIGDAVAVQIFVHVGHTHQPGLAGARGGHGAATARLAHHVLHEVGVAPPAAAAAAAAATPLALALALAAQHLLLRSRRPSLQGAQGGNVATPCGRIAANGPLGEFVGGGRRGRCATDDVALVEEEELGTVVARAQRIHEACARPRPGEGNGGHGGSG